jgi:hypothetical protein
MATAKNQSMNLSNQKQEGEMGGAFTEDEANKKRLRRENGVSRERLGLLELNKCL